MEINNIDFTHWFFDLDNTLYCANSGIFDQIHKKMGEFISKNLKVSLKEAKFLQKKYFIENGTTLYGLMINHNINPKEFLYKIFYVFFEESLYPYLERPNCYGSQLGNIHFH